MVVQSHFWGDQRHAAPIHLVDQALYKKYGRLFGSFEAGKPALYVSEPDLIKLVLVRDFTSLSDRKLNNIIADCARITAEHLRTCEGDLEVKAFYANFGLDFIARCLFGIKLKPHSDVTNKFVIEAKSAFSRNLTLPLIAIYLLPGFIQWFNVKLFNFDIIRCFKDLAGNAIRERDNGGHKSEDYVQLLMDAREERHDTNEYPNRCETPERSERRTMATFFSALSELEVLAQCVVMFLSGQDSTSSVIAHTVYLLALHPDKQMKLREEVDRCFSSHGEDISSEVVLKLDYLHAVVSEALRLFPPATREHGEDSGTVHVDAARHGDHFVAAVVRAKDGGLVTAASIRTQEVRVAEEVAIALAASLPTVKVVLSDSMRALRNFMAGRISQAAARTLDNKSCGKVTLKWYPAHEEGNAVADAMARALGDRAGSQSSHYEPREYGEMLRTFRLDRQLLPAPHPNLTRKEAVVFRQSQTRCMFTPVIGKHILPDLFQDDMCKLCKSDRATLAHIAWDCTKRRREASQEADLPPEFKDATESDNYEVQLQAVQQIAALLERQSPRRVLATT
ncbi:hypothetical protein HPB47_025581 [Ixodes persulcatus]|uniref:Uncharacterized protein n=1 Tax=Ixodes persulcatus TaxID=34615 RepID=A0AC60Q154_IXOPE|nr:hypothetical protein HPB47_025581 [Ixodes persulcatus]